MDGMGGKTRAVRLFHDMVVFESTDPSQKLQRLEISRSSADGAAMITTGHAGEVVPEDGGSGQLIPIDAIFGIYELLSGPYIALILDSEIKFRAGQPGTPRALEFRKVSKVAIVPLFSQGRLLTEARQRDEDRYLDLLHSTFSAHSLFFSYQHDVTHTLQRCATMRSDARRRPLWARADDRFFWNRDLVKGLIDCGAEDWITPVMSAHLEVRAGCRVGKHGFSLLFVSRRSRHRQGCRFSRRGVDPAGNVANFVETEQVLLHEDGLITGHVQVRGSIPVFWRSPVTMKYAPRVQIAKDESKSVQAFQQHVRGLAGYGPRGVIIVNLIDEKKDQLALGKMLETVVAATKERSDKAAELPPVRLVWFDFHHECRKMKWHNLAKLVAIVDDDFQKQGFFSWAPDGKILQTQSGVLRTNCMDNLDRTNVVQSIFARRTLLLQLGVVVAAAAVADAGGANGNGSSGGGSKAGKAGSGGGGGSSSGGSVLESPYPQLERAFKDVWANNADAISKLYAGTGALKTDFTRYGKRTRRGALADGVNSVMRYYINNFVDGARQDGLDLLLGCYRPDVARPSPFVLRPQQETPSSFLTKLFVLTVAIFTALVLVGGGGGGRQSRSLERNFVMAVATTAACMAVIVWRMVKTGTRMGENLVALPVLCPEV